MARNRVRTATVLLLATLATPAAGATPEIDPCSLAQAEATRLAGPARLERTGGEPERQILAFEVSVRSLLCIGVASGASDPPGGQRISSAVIALDGQVVIDPSAWNQEVDRVVARAEVNPGRHEISVDLRSAPEAFVVVEVVGVPLVRLAPLSGAATTLTVEAASPTPSLLTVQALDLDGHPVAGVPVDFAIATAHQGPLAGLESVDGKVRAAGRRDSPPVTATTDAGGTAAVRFLPPRRQGGLVLVSASLPGTTVTMSFTIEVAPAGLRWAQLPQGTPPARADHSAIFAAEEQALVIFGGATPDPGGGVRYFNDVWAYDVSSGGAGSWTQIFPKGIPPSPRQQHVAVYVPEHRLMVVHGGAPTPFDDDQTALLRFGPGRFEATWIGLGALSPQPPPLVDAAAIYDVLGRSMVVVGADFTSSVVGTLEVWALDLSDPGHPRWERLRGVGGDFDPAPRRAHAAVYDAVRDRMIIFGGLGKNADGTPRFFDDVWTLGLRSATPGFAAWRRIVTSSDSPGPRVNHAAYYDPIYQRLVTMGGFSARTSGRTNDVYALTFDTTNPCCGTWTALAPSGVVPEPRLAHTATAVLDRANERALIFGGENPRFEDTDELFELAFDTGPFAPLVGRVQFAPVAIYADGRDQTRLEITPGNLRLGVVRVEVLGLDGFLVDGVPVASGAAVALNDEGLDGDRVAGDQIWSRGGIAHPGPVRRFPPDTRWVIVRTVYGDGSELRLTEVFGLVDPSMRATTLARDSGLVLTDRAAVLIDPAGEILPSYAVIPDDAPMLAFLHRAVQRFYDRFQDRFDFVALVTARDLQAPSFGYLHVRNDVQHIGVPIFDDSATVCGDPARCTRLLGFWDHRVAPYSITHEVGHQWSMYVWHDIAFALGDGAHWRPWGARVPAGDPGAPLYYNDGKSVMAYGGNFWTSVGDGRTFVKTRRTARFELLDLYLMGLAGPFEVRPYDVMRNGDLLPDGRLVVDPTDPLSTIHIVTILDILASLGGERVPSAAASPHDFRIAIVVLIPESPTPAELGYYSELSRWFAWREPEPPPEAFELDYLTSPFFYATFGRATMDSRLSLGDLR